jgi:hypothetical protein
LGSLANSWQKYLENCAGKINDPHLSKIAHGNVMYGAKSACKPLAKASQRIRQNTTSQSRANFIRLQPTDSAMYFRHRSNSQATVPLIVIRNLSTALQSLRNL